MQPKLPAFDPRYFQVIFQAFFLTYGIFFLGWAAEWTHYACSIGGCLLFNYIAECVNRKRLLTFTGRFGFSIWGFSILISAMSLCLLLKTTHWYTSVAAALLTVLSKYILKVEGRHVFNPSAFGIIAVIVLSDDAWLSPAQWGTNVVMFFTIVTLGTIVVTRVQKLDISLAFLCTYVALLFWRQVYVVGWPADYFHHSVSTGSLLLFGFFMISDPKTTPHHPLARILWAMSVAAVSFYLSAFQWKYNTPLWVLVGAAPLVPFLNKVFKASAFSWKKETCKLPILSLLKKTV